MPLTCDGPYADSGEYYVVPDDYSAAKSVLTCVSCRKKISAGDVIAEFEIMYYDEDGEEQYQERPDTLCEVCADLFFSLRDLGFNLDLGEDMRGLVREYIAMREAGEFG